MSTKNLQLVDIELYIPVLSIKDEIESLCFQCFIYVPTTAEWAQTTKEGGCKNKSRANQIFLRIIWPSNGLNGHIMSKI